MRKFDWKKYLLVLIITAAVFGTAWWLSGYANEARVASIRSTESQISIDLLSSETQFALLEQSSCSATGTDELSGDLESLGDELAYLESSGANTSDLDQLKQSYSLLEIRDYLLTQTAAERCNQKPVTILYFYSNSGDCADCEKAGYALTALRQTYPSIRVYSFDYHLDLSALNTLEKIEKLNGQLPAFVVNGKVVYGFQSIEDFQNLIPQLKTMATSTSGS